MRSILAALCLCLLAAPAGAQLQMQGGTVGGMFGGIGGAMKGGSHGSRRGRRADPPPAHQAVDKATAEAVIKRCVAIYQESGQQCACDFNTDKLGNSCDGRSANGSNHPRRIVPVCKPDEVTPELAKDFRTNEQKALRERCHNHGR